MLFDSPASQVALLLRCKHLFKLEIFLFTALTLSIFGPDPATVIEPVDGDTMTFNVTVTLSTQRGNTLGSTLEVCLEDGSGTACTFYTL